jgi:hypothetical protein
VLRAKERALTPCFSVVFYLGLTFGSLKEIGARQKSYFQWAFATFDLPITKHQVASNDFFWLDTKGGKLSNVLDVGLKPTKMHLKIHGL